MTLNVLTASQRLRALLAASQCIVLASVYDPISVRIAGDLGYECGLVGGSMASLVVLGAPDLSLITLSELVEQVVRVTRAAPLPLLVDADHGYGNALGTMRAVRDLERAGAAGLTIEDTCLPQPYGQTRESLISIEEGVGKIRAAIEARSDPALVIAARTHALRVTDLADTVARCVAYADAGADALFLLGVEHSRQLEQIRCAVGCPLLLAQYGKGLNLGLSELAELGVRAVLYGHDAARAAVHALRDTLAAQLPAAPGRCLPSFEDLTRSQAYAEAASRYLMPAATGDAVPVLPSDGARMG